MTSLDRAKAFLRRNVRTLALTAVPLASLAGLSAPAYGGAVGLTLSPAATCSVTPTGGSLASGGSCTDAALSTGSNGMTGVKMYGNGQVNAGGGTPVTVDFLLSGTANGGQIPGAIPLSFAFTVSDSDAVTQDISYTVTWTINGSNLVTNFGSGQHAGSFSGTNSGFSALVGTTVTSYKIELSVTDSNVASGGFLAVSIPQNSIDFNAVSVSAPEPGTFAMLGSALLGLGGFALRRRKR